MRSTRAWRCAAVLAGVAAAAAPAGSGAQGAGPGIRVGESTMVGDPEDPLRGRDFPAVAVDPGDPDHLVLVDQDLLTGNCDVHTTFDGGRTWIDARLTAPAAFTNPPCPTFDSGGYAHFNQSVAFGAGQNVYVTFSSQLVPAEPPEGRIRQGDSVLVAKSSDGGRTFGPAVVAIAGSAESQPYFIRPGVAVEPSPQGDRLYVAAWGLVVTTGGAGGGPGDRRAVTTRSDDGGATWTPPVDAAAPGEQVREITEPVVGSDGTVYVAWRNRDPAPAVNTISVGKSTDRGGTWTQLRAGVVTGAGISANGGFPRMAIDRRSNALYLVYQGTNFGDLDIIFQRSTDGGATWSTPLRVNDEARSNGAQQLTPNVAVGPDGRVHVVWFDRRGGFVVNGQNPASRGAGDIYYASSTDGGQTFSANRRISDRSLNLDAGLNAEAGSFIWYSPEVVPVGTDEVLVAWSDPRNGSIDNETQDVFWSRVELTPGGGPSSEAFDRGNRVDFSIALSQLAYPGGSERVGRNDPSRIVVVGEDETPAVALVGAALARGFYGPLLVSPAGGLTDGLKDEVRRLRPGGVFLLGNDEALSDEVMADLADAGVAANVVRITGDSAADVAKAAAEAMDLRAQEAREQGTVAAFDTAVVVNPDTVAEAGGAAAAALAAADRAPVLFAQRESVPAQTGDVVRDLGVRETLVVGGPGSVSDAVLSQLPSAKRLGGDDVQEVSISVARESVDRGLPSNVVYVADSARPFDQAVLGAAVGRLGGIMLSVPGASADRALEALQRALPGVAVDRVVVARTSAGGGLSALVVAISALLAGIGLALLLAAVVRARRGPSAPSRERERPTAQAGRT